MNRMIAAIGLIMALTAGSASSRVDDFDDRGGFPAGRDGTTFLVPGDFSSIQDAIDAASDLDTIVVLPGTYQESIDFSGKAVVVRSRSGASDTVIDGNQAGSVVSFTSNEGSGSVLDGFTIVNGTGTTGLWSYLQGGGICCRSSSPVIRNNTISGNSADMGGGIYCNDSSPEISRNTIKENSAYKGGGLYAVDASSPLLLNNMILDNDAGSHGGGICCWNQTSVVITNNTIFRNSCTREGGGIYGIRNSSIAVTNTILWANTAAEGPEIWLGDSAHPSILSISDSDVMGGAAMAHVGNGCTLDWGDGMIDADPLFIDPDTGDLHLDAGSPCLESGNNDVGTLPEDDFEGDRRISLITVDIGADELSDGLTFRVPLQFPTIQEGIDAAFNRDEVTVAAGTYVENIVFNGRKITVTSDDGAEDTVIDGNQAGSVVTFSSCEGRETVLSGFTITNGNTGAGAGICCTHSSPTLRENVVTSNSASGWGGGLCCQSQAAPLVEDNTFFGNSAYQGGAIGCNNSSPEIRSNSILGNGLTGFGGGIWCGGSATPLITENSITGNQNTGILCEDSAPTIMANVISSNSSFTSAGGIGLFNSDALILCNVISGNAAVYGAGIYCYDSDATITNNTIRTNWAFSTGGGLYCSNSSPVITNTIFWDDLAAASPEIEILSGNPLITYCDVEGGWPGTGNIDYDPVFFNPDESDFHLIYQSPCRNAGSNTAAQLSAFDFEGDPRVADDTADIGADEFHLHIYYQGDVLPGGELLIITVGTPYTAPVTLCLGGGIEDPPVPTAYGDLYLVLPVLAANTLNPIAYNGISESIIELPMSWQSGESHPFQALALAMSNPNARLTNLMVLVVE